MTEYIPWNSQPLAAWAEKYARGKFIELDGLQTHYIEKGEGEPVILIHGFFFDSHMWDTNLDVLTERYKVYVPDLWGFGYSTRKPLDYGYPLYARQLELFMDALGISKATLVGQSMGAGTMIKFCVDHRQRVEKMVLVDPAVLPHKLPLLGQFANLPWVGELILGLPGNFMRTFSLKNSFIYNHSIITPEFFETITRFQKVEATNEVLLAVLRKQFFHTLEVEVSQVGHMQIPALIVGGRQSVAEPTLLTQHVHQLLAGSQLEILDQAGHCPNVEQAEVFNRLTLQFLGE